MSENPYESSQVTAHGKPSLSRLIWPAIAVVFFILWARSEYMLYTFNHNYEQKEQAVIEWSRRDPAFREFLSDRLNRASSNPPAE